MGQPNKLRKKITGVIWGDREGRIAIIIGGRLILTIKDINLTEGKEEKNGMPKAVGGVGTIVRRQAVPESVHSEVCR